MSYRGHLKNGVVVFAEQPPLPDGTEVTVTPVEVEPRPLLERLRAVVGIAKGLPADLAENHDHYLHGHPKK